MLMSFSPLSSYGDIITKDGVKIQFFKKGQKKSIPKSDLIGEYGLSLYDYECLDKIVLSVNKTRNDSPYYSIKIYNSNNDIILRKSNIIVSEKNKGFVLPIYPWIDESDNYKIEIMEGENMVVQINYTVSYEEGYTDNEN